MPHTALRRYRIEQGYSQPQLARLLGVSQPTVWNYEHGVTFPESRRVRQRLTALFGVPPAVLLSAENANGGPKPAAQ